MNMIEFALCAEDRNRLDAILAELQKLNQANGQQKITVTPEQMVIEPAENDQAATIITDSDKLAIGRVEPVKDGRPEEAPKAEPVQAPAEEPKTEAPQAPQVSVAELQAKVVELVSAGKRDAAKAVVNEYAERVSDIPEDKRHEVMQKLAALEG